MGGRFRNIAGRIGAQIKALLLGIRCLFSFRLKKRGEKDEEETVVEPIEIPGPYGDGYFEPQGEETRRKEKEVFGQEEDETQTEPESKELITTEEKQAPIPWVQSELHEEEKPKKPKIIKPPTEGEARHPEIASGNGAPGRSKTRITPIYLGGHGKTRPKRKKPRKEYESELDKKEKSTKESGYQSIIKCPFIEIDLGNEVLDEVVAYLVLPEQRLKTVSYDNPDLEKAYEVRINDGVKEKIPVKCDISNQSLAYIEESRIRLKEPLKSLEVKYPCEIQERRIYYYKHLCADLYVFLGGGANRGRLFYLCDETANINPIPKKKVWVALSDEYVLRDDGIDVIVEDMRLLWDSYSLYTVNLERADHVIIEEKARGIIKKIPCCGSFSIEGDCLVEDYFVDQSPLFCGGNLKIRAPRKNFSKWQVWIQSEKASSKMVADGWDGEDTLTLNLPQDLPCEYGEFQLDICQKNPDSSEETLFFRWINYIDLKYPKELLIPDPKTGSRTERVIIKLDDLKDWQLSVAENIKSIIVDEMTMILLVESEIDGVQFYIARKGSADKKINLKVVMSRLKWKFRKENKWRNRPCVTKIDGFDFGDVIMIRSNDFKNRYDLIAVLEKKGNQVQEAKLVRKGLDYVLGLGQLYDTVKTYKNSLALKVKIKKESQLVGIVELIRFKNACKISKRGQPMLVLVQNRYGFRNGKGFSRKEIFAAGLTIEKLRQMNCIYDKRRKTCHAINVEALKRMGKAN
ncbi:MAG: hypothetical protein PHU81_02720 [Acidobacteriota bacterium]|nr:hypothetical protein [Acidobacteriota bacterium]